MSTLAASDTFTGFRRVSGCKRSNSTWRNLASLIGRRQDVDVVSGCGGQ